MRVGRTASATVAATASVTGGPVAVAGVRRVRAGRTASATGRQAGDGLGRRGC
ncbi:MAG: hypothetical protein LBE08_08390 [Bifidobacteriaceae bacterium]|nr:hypothetical protein [Bifidobacteriaceae bacterium]